MLTVIRKRERERERERKEEKTWNTDKRKFFILVTRKNK
jgi:hypothetical protein